MNKCILIGNIGKDIKIVNKKDGKPGIVTFSLATKERRWNGTEMEEYTEWHNILCRNLVAEKASNFLPGDGIHMEGKHITSKYQKKDGTTAYSSQFEASFIMRIEKGKASKEEDRERRPSSSIRPEQHTESELNPEENPGDLPF